MHNYIAIIHKEPDSDFGVSFPDFPGCITAGSTLQEAMEMAREALAFHIDGMAEDGDLIPEPSSLDQIEADPDNRGGVAVLVTAPVGDKPMRINISVPESDLRAIDEFAKSHGYTRSGLLVAGARRLMDAAD